MDDLKLVLTCKKCRCNVELNTKNSGSPEIRCQNCGTQVQSKDRAALLAVIDAMKALSDPEGFSLGLEVIPSGWAPDEEIY